MNATVDEFVAAVTAQGIPQFEALAAVAAVRNYCGWHIIPPRPGATPAGPGGCVGYTPNEAADAVMVARSIGKGAARAPGGAEREQVGSASVQWGGGASTGALTAYHKTALDPYKTPPLP